MLNKDICKKCCNADIIKNRHNGGIYGVERNWNNYHTVSGFKIDYDKDWEEGVVHCPSQSQNKEEAFNNCPYKLEHILSKEI
jgi:hypothetical protein